MATKKKEEKVDEATSVDEAGLHIILNENGSVQSAEPINPKAGGYPQ